MNELNNLISVKQISESTGLSISTIHYWCEFGLISPIKTFGKLYLFEKSDVLRKIKTIKEEQDKNRKKLSEIKKIVNKK